MLNYALAVALFCCGRTAVNAAQPPGITLPVHTIQVKGAPSHLFVHQDKLFVSCFPGGNLGIFDTTTRKELQQLFLDAYGSPANPKTGGPRRVERCVPGDIFVVKGKLFVAQMFGDHLVVFDLKTMWVVKRLYPGGDGSSPPRPTARPCTSQAPIGRIPHHRYGNLQIQDGGVPAGGRGLWCI